MERTESDFIFRLHRLDGIDLLVIPFGHAKLMAVDDGRPVDAEREWYIGFAGDQRFNGLPRSLPVAIDFAIRKNSAVFERMDCARHAQERLAGLAANA